MDPGSAIVRVRGLVHRYPGGVCAVNDVSFDVAPGEVVAIIGPSGAGKSTLLRCLNRLVEPTSGSVMISGQDVLAASRRQLYRIRRNIGMVFQHLNLIDRSTVLDNALAGRLGYLPRWRSVLAPVGLDYFWAGAAARKFFEDTFSKKELPADIKAVELPSGLSLSELILRSGGVKSRNEARRLVSQGAVKIDGKKISQDDVVSAPASFVLQMGKHQFVRVKLT